MVRCTARSAVAIAVAAIALGCMTATPTPSAPMRTQQATAAIPTPEAIPSAPTASPPTSADPTRTLPIPTVRHASQDAILGAVGEWLTVNAARLLNSAAATSVLDHVGSPPSPSTTGGMPEPRSGEPTTALTQATRDALEATLGTIRNVEFVADADSVDDYRTFVRLRGPVPSGDRFLVEVKLDQHFQGVAYVVAVDEVDSGYEVTLVSETQWTAGPV